jgi:Carboxypeptidase regulatory-like domain
MIDRAKASPTPRRSRIAIAVGAVVLAIVAWWGLPRGSEPPAGRPPGQPATASRGTGRDFSDAIARSRARAAKLPLDVPRYDGEVTISGRVIDVRQQQPVGNIEVVFRSLSGESSTTTGPDGEYAIRVAPGLYRAFVRDDTVLSVGRPDLVRLPTLPSAETAGVPDEALMALVLASADTEGVDLSVVRGGIVTGHVVDRSGRPIAGAVLRARGGGGMRPALATDLAETDRDGSFELRLPAGVFHLDANHPRFAGVAEIAGAAGAASPAGPTSTRIALAPGDHLQTTITLTAGCVISGRVVGPGGRTASDGAIERQWGQGDFEFAPAGQIEPDGKFRWVTTDEVDVTLRAWPWKSPPSASRQFTCRDGARFDDVVFQVLDRRPDLDGVLVDQAGAPVGLAFVDLAPLDPGGIAQQERSDAAGRWSVYNMPPGRYRVTAQAEGRGVTSQTVVSPHDGVRLQLGGTGRIEGTAPRLLAGSFELVLGTCSDGTSVMPLPQTRRLVTVLGGRFAVDNVPACELSFFAIWHGRPISAHATIPSGGTAHVELDLGPQVARTVHGVVRDAAGQPLAGVQVTATDQGDDEVTATTDASGAYSLSTSSGATVSAIAHGRIGFAQVGGAGGGGQVDLVVEDVADDVELED